MVKMVFLFALLARVFGLCFSAYWSATNDQKRSVWSGAVKLLALVVFTLVFVIGIVAVF